MPVVRRKGLVTGIGKADPVDGLYGPSLPDIGVDTDPKIGVRFGWQLRHEQPGQAFQQVIEVRFPFQPNRQSHPAQAGTQTGRRRRGTLSFPSVASGV